MADNADKIVGILLQFKQDGDTSKAVADLQAVHKASSELSKNQYDLEADLGKVEKRFEGVSGQSRETYRIFLGLDRIMPGMGETMRGLVTGPLGMIGAALYVFYDAQKWIDDLNKSLDKLGEDAAMSGNKMTSALEEARQKGQQMSQEMEDHLTSLKQKQNELTDSVHDFIEALNEQSEFTDRAINAAADQKIEKAKELLALGLITRDQAILLEAQAKADAQNAIAAQKKADLEQDRRENQSAFNAAQGNEQIAQSAMQKAEAAAFSSPEAITRQAQITTMQDQARAAADNQAKDREALNKAQADFDALKKVHTDEQRITDAENAIANPNTTPEEKQAYQHLIDYYKKELEGLQQTTSQGLVLTQAQNQYNQDQYFLSPEFQQSIVRLETQQNELTSAYQNAKTKYDQMASSMDQFQKAIDADTAKLNALNSPAATNANTQQHAADVAGTLAQLAAAGGLPADIERAQAGAKSVADKVEGGQTITGDEGNALISFAQAMGARVQTVKAAADWLEQNLGTDDQILALIQRCVTLQNQHGAQTQQIQTGLTQFQNKLQHIEKMLNQHASQMQNGMR